MVGIRILANPDDPEDMRLAHALQDAITVSQPGGPGTFEIPDWDPVSQKRVREALIALSDTLPDLRYAAGPDERSVDPVRRIAAAASGWGLNPDRDAVYLNVFPERNDGKTPYRLTARDVPVFRAVEPRFEGLVEEHRTLVLVDPTGNLWEFKHYVDPRMMY